MHLTYGSLWNNTLKLMIDPMSAEEARTLYEGGGTVMVAGGPVPLQGIASDSADPDPEDPEPAVWSLYAKLADDYLEVQFMSFFGTREATYSFRRQPDGRLFLTHVTEYDFAQRTMNTGDWDWSTVTNCEFQPDGYSKVVARTRTADGGQDVAMTDHRGGTFDSHWEPVPTFGDWDSITRRQR